MKLGAISVGILAAVFSLRAAAMPGGHGHGAGEGARAAATGGCAGMAAAGGPAHGMHAGMRHGMAHGGEHMHRGPMHGGPAGMAPHGHRHGAQPPATAESPAKP